MTDALASSQDPSPDVIPPDCIGREVLVQRCQQLEMSALHHQHVTREEMDTKRPGGSGNPDTSATGWLSYLCDLHRWHATAMSGAVVQREMPRFTEQDAEDLRKSQLEEPLYLTLSDGGKRGVFPKGSYALHRLRTIELYLAWLMPHRLVLEAEEKTPPMREALEASINAQQELQCQYLWIATHPGAGVPWTDFSVWQHTPAAWTQSHTGVDFMTVVGAHHEVNYSRNNVISARTHALAGLAQGEPMTQESFNAIMAKELSVPSVRELSLTVSQCALYAMAHEQWMAQRRADEKAKQAA